MNEIIVSHKSQAETDLSITEGGEWIVEGDFGFIGDFATRSAAYAVANEFAAQAGATVQGNE